MKARLGLDAWAVGIHLFVTIAVTVAFDSAVRGRDADIGVPLLLATSAIIFEWRRRRALASGSAPGLTTGEVQLERIAELEARVAEVEMMQVRMAELEERLDFSERLLVQSRPAELGQGREPR